MRGRLLDIDVHVRLCALQGRQPGEALDGFLHGDAARIAQLRRGGALAPLGGRALLLGRLGLLALSWQSVLLKPQGSSALCNCLQDGHFWEAHSTQDKLTSTRTVQSSNKRGDSRGSHAQPTTAAAEAMGRPSAALAMTQRHPRQPCLQPAPAQGSA